jgi:hypothetical protein
MATEASCKDGKDLDASLHPLVLASFMSSWLTAVRQEMEKVLVAVMMLEEEMV